MSVTIETDFSQVTIAAGVPRRVNRSPFKLREVVEGFSINKTFISEKKQEEYYKSAIKEDTGWLMYLCCLNDMETGRLIAANIVACYSEKYNYRAIWQNLGNSENVKAAHFPHLVVIDGLFDDSPAYRRDRVYDLMTYHHDRPETSIIVIGKTQSPSYMSKVIGLRPNFALQVTG